MDRAKIFTRGSQHIKEEFHRRDLRSELSVKRYKLSKFAAATGKRFEFLGFLWFNFLNLVIIIVKSLWKLVICCLVSIIRVRKLVWTGFNCFVHGDYWFKYLMVFRVFQNSKLVSLGSNSLAIVTDQYVQAPSGYIFEVISKYCSKVLFISKYFSIDSKYYCSTEVLLLVH